MATKVETKNTETKTVEVPVIKVQDLKPKLKVTDLSTGNDGAEIELAYRKYTAPEYDSKKHGTRDQYTAALLTAATALVSPVENQIDALLYRATQDSYQAGKVAAYAGGNYLSPELRSQIVMVIKNSSPVYAESSASDAFNAWKAAFTGVAAFNGKDFTPEQITSRKAGATKVLNTAQALSDSGADAF